MKNNVPKLTLEDRKTRQIQYEHFKYFIHY